MYGLFRIILRKMSQYSDRMFSSDLDAYRSDGVVQVRSVTFTGTVAAGAISTQTATSFTLTNLDFYQILFDNSVYSPTKYRDVNLEGGTMIHETTSPSDLTAWFETKVNGNTLTISAKLFNPYSMTITLQDTTINFRFVAYDSTLL